MKQNILYRFFNGETTPQEEVRIRKWMESSPENRNHFFRERQLFDSLILLSKKQRINTSGTLTQKSFRFHLRTLIRAAAIIVAVCIISIKWLPDNSFPDPGMHSLYVPAGQRVHITLPDGTSVWLNAHSTLEYPGTFIGDQRVVTLNGEAFFEVASHTASPFIVQTSKGEIEVTGTSFNVEAYADEAGFSTSLMEGSVIIRHGKRALELKPGQCASLEEGLMKVTPITDLNPYRWKEGLICFRDEPLEQIFKKFEKYYDVKILIDPNKKLTASYTGKFRQSDGIEYALRVLQKDIRFKFNRDPNNPIIHIK